MLPGSINSPLNYSDSFNGLFQRNSTFSATLSAVDGRPFSITTKRLFPCVFDPTNGQTGCSFTDADDLLHHYTFPLPLDECHRPSRLHLNTLLSFAADVALQPAAWSHGRCPCLARHNCSWNSKQKGSSLCCS